MKIFKNNLSRLLYNLNLSLLKTELTLQLFHAGNSSKQIHFSNGIKFSCPLLSRNYYIQDYYVSIGIISLDKTVPIRVYNEVIFDMFFTYF